MLVCSRMMLSMYYYYQMTELEVVAHKQMISTSPSWLPLTQVFYSFPIYVHTYMYVGRNNIERGGGASNSVSL